MEMLSMHVNCNCEAFYMLCLPFHMTSHTYISQENELHVPEMYASPITNIKISASRRARTREHSISRPALNPLNYRGSNTFQRKLNVTVGLN